MLIPLALVRTGRELLLPVGPSVYKITGEQAQKKRQPFRTALMAFGKIRSAIIGVSTLVTVRASEVISDLWGLLLFVAHGELLVLGVSNAARNTYNRCCQ